MHKETVEVVRSVDKKPYTSDAEYEFCDTEAEFKKKYGDARVLAMLQSQEHLEASKDLAERIKAKVDPSKAPKKAKATKIKL